MKKYMIIIGSVLVVSILGLGVYHSDASQKGKILTEKEISDLVQSQYPGQITELELEDGKNMYEVEIKGENAEYELKLDAVSGEVRKLEEKHTMVVKEEPEKQAKEESPKTTISKSEKVKVQEKQPEKKQTVISKDEAIQIATNQFSGKVKDVDLDEEDGRLVYEIEIVQGNQEAEIDIDAYTGEVIVIEIETED